MAVKDRLLSFFFRDSQEKASETGRVVATQRDVILHDKAMYRSFEYYENCRDALKEALEDYTKKRGIPFDRLAVSAEVDNIPNELIPQYCRKFGAREVVSYPPSFHPFGSE